MSRPIALPLASTALAVAIVTPLAAQDLTPRAYWPAPKGAKVASVGYGYNTGDILVDPALPVEGLESESHNVKAGYYQTINLAGRTANISLEAPLSNATFEGDAFGEARKRTVSGFGDLKLRLAVNLLGAPSMDMARFQKFRTEVKDILGASLVVNAPTGQYNEQRLLNLGTNRWALQPEVGYIRRLSQKWLAEFELAASIYGDNDEYFGGQTLEQDPLGAVEIHFVRRIKPGRWLSLDVTSYWGGQTTVDGEPMDTKQKNTRMGATFVYPLTRHHVARVAFSTGLFTESGGDFDSLLLAYSYVWN